MTVTKISLQRFGGTMRWKGQTEANPKGSQEGWQLAQPCMFDAEMELGSLLEDKLVFKKLELDGLDIRVENDPLMGNGKISVIMDHLKKLGGGDEPEKEEDSEGKKLQADFYTPRTTTKPVDGNDTATP
jgi:hypothetical protein